MFKRIVILLLTTLAILIIAVGIFLTVLPSGSEYSNKVYSQDRAYAVQLVEINGGATTAYTSGVSIVDEESFFKNFDFLSVQMGARTGVFAFNGVKASVQVAWEDMRTLKITYADCSKIIDQDKSWKDVKIVYEEQCIETK